MLSELAALLLHLQGPLEFRKGAAMLLVTSGFGTRGPARLEWFLTPRVLREIAGGRADAYGIVIVMTMTMQRGLLSAGPPTRRCPRSSANS